LCASVEDLLFGHLHSVLRDDVGLHGLATVAVRQTHHAAVGDAVDGQDDGLHLGGVDVEPAGDDDVFPPLHDGEVAVGVHPGHVAGQEPPAVVDTVLRGGRVLGGGRLLGG